MATAQGILDAAGVTVPTGDLVQGAYDEMGGLYVLPGWVVGEPEGVVDEEAEEGKESVLDEGGKDVGSGEKKGKEVAVDAGGGGVEGMVRVRARLSDRGGPDVVVLIGREDSVAVLARRIAEQAKVRLPPNFPLYTPSQTSPQALTRDLSLHPPAPPQIPDPNRLPRQDLQRSTVAPGARVERRARCQRLGLPMRIYICHIYPLSHCHSVAVRYLYTAFKRGGGFRDMDGCYWLQMPGLLSSTGYRI